jgi:hypothetical protein
VQKRTPVCLSEPHGAASLACLVGDKVIWNGAASHEALALEPALRRFAASARLTFVEIALAAVRRGLAVVFVEPRPGLEQFDEPARARILDALAAALTQSRVATPQAPLVLS